MSQNCLLAVQACDLGSTLFNIRKKKRKSKNKIKYLHSLFEVDTWQKHRPYVGRLEKPESGTGSGIRDRNRNLNGNKNKEGRSYISSCFSQLKKSNVILHTLNSKIDFYGYCCDDKVCTTDVTPVLDGLSSLMLRE